MDWYLRQWNERSFSGWIAWWQRVALFALGVVLLGSWFGTGPGTGLVSLAVFFRTAFLIGAGCMGLAWLTAASGAYSWRAALAGWSKLLPVVVLVPLVDAATRWLAPALVHGEWWFDLTQLPWWLLAGWAHGGFASFGLTLFVMVCAVAMVTRLMTAGIGRAKAVAFGVMTMVCLWFALAIPSFVAWTQLSTYGTTFAPAPRVVEQAFARVWSKSLWYSQAERFLDVRTIDAQIGERFVLAIMSWLLVFVLFAPAMSRAKRGSWKEYVQASSLPVAPVFGGVILGLTQVIGQTFFASMAFVVFFGALLVLLARVLRRAETDQDMDERWLAMALLLSGGLLLGWSAFLLLLAALALMGVGRVEGDWWMRAGFRGGAWALLFLFGTNVVARASMGVFSPLLILGIFGAFKALSLVLAYQESGDKTAVIGSRHVSGRSLEHLLLWGWVVSIGLLWWGTGQVAFGGPALVLALLAPAALWLLPLQGKRGVTALFLIPVLLGLLLRPGIFLP